MSIIIIDYNCGNPLSIHRMFEKIGEKSEIISNPKNLSSATKIILPGVGSFDYGMENLKQTGMLEALNEAVLQKKIPILGICLGMQLFCRTSEEGKSRGLSWLNADVKRFSFDPLTKLKIPHMGWNIVNPVNNSSLFSLNSPELRFYHVHSYHVVCDEIRDISATTNYGYNFTTAIEKENILGVQFHPEKSHKFGMNLFKNFIQLKC